MTCFGVDVHPRYQAGINIGAIRAEGFDFMAVKVSEGRDVSYMAAGSAEWLRRGRALGLLTLGYHYLRPGDEDTQARLFAAQLRAAGGVPGMLDAEALDTTGRPTLTMAGIRAFVGFARAYGAHVPLVYVPRWYWQRLGSPSLTGLPPLWASSYPSRAVGTAAELYRAVGADRWTGYGGGRVEILQFAETGLVAGRQPVDVNAYRGSRAQLAALLGAASPEDDMPTPQDLWAHKLRDPFVTDPNRPDAFKTAGDLVAWSATHAAHALAEAAGARAAIAEFAKQFAAEDFDAEALILRMQEAVRGAMAEIVRVDITVADRTDGDDSGPPT